jgi:DNA ligase (NAD+)
MITLENIDLQKISIEDLGELLIEAKKAYYTSGKPIMDDHTYDTLEEILKKKSPYHRLFSKVGNTNFNTGFDKKKHTMPMGSLNKVNLYADLVHYFRLKKIPSNSKFVVEPKCDGISLEIEYKDRKLADAITRGDGRMGDVITQNVVRMKNFVEKFSASFTGSVRCEIVVTNKDFGNLNKISDESYSNSRNAASGISQRLDGKFSEYCSLFAVDVYSPEMEFDSEENKIKFLKNHGFTTVDSFVCSNLDEIEKIYQKFLIKDRNDYPFEIDGLVIKLNDLEFQRQLGSHNNRPKGQVAYKFPARTSETRIISVNWQVGPMGLITPVAQVDPIEISGAIITFASLANYDLIKEKNINIDDIVEISRRGDVIPHIEKVVSKVTEDHIAAPTHCPSCGTKLIVDNKFLRCPNIKNCPAQILGSLKLFCDTLEIKGISDKTIKKLHIEGLVNLPGDFYKLKVSDFENLAGLGHKSGTNIVNEIQNKKELTLKQVLDAAVIPNFSSARIQQIISAGFDTPEKILKLTVADLENLPGIQTTLAKKIFEGIQARKNFIESILSQVKLKEDFTSNKLDGLTFAITGTLSRPRKDIENEIQSKGGKIVSAVSNNTSYLVTNEQESNSSKFVNAKKYGVKIINEDGLLKLIQ